MNKISYQRWSDRSTGGNVKHVYILAVCPYNMCDDLPYQLNMALDHACWKMKERSLRYLVKRELPKHKKCERTNGVITHYVMKFQWFIG